MALTSIQAGAFPAQIILIRHAEKPVNEKSEDLSEKGFQRAQALTKIFEVHPELARNGIPDFLYAAKYIPGDSSRRSIQTLEPLAQQLNLQISSNFFKEDFETLARDLLVNPKYNRKSILIAWTHSYLPKFAMALGSAPQKKWDSAVFDRIWWIQFDPRGRASFLDLAQNLLPGDSP